MSESLPHIPQIEKRTYEPMFVANDLLGDDAALQDRMGRDGYLYFKGLLPGDDLQKIRSDITGILASKKAILDGDRQNDAISIVMPFREGEEAFFDVYDEIVKLESFHTLAHHPQLTAMMRSVLGPSVFPHPLSIARLAFPDNPEVTTPPHQDYPNNQGSKSLTATWIPLGDCPAEMGGLAVLEGSHKFGVLPLKIHLGAGNRQADLPPELDGLHWVSTDFEMGDVLVFGAMTVHAARVNTHPDRMRLSVDFRFQLEGESMTSQCIEPHFQRVSWSEIYSGWSSTELQYYWKDKDFEIVDFDESMHAIDDEAALESLKQNMVYDAARKRRFKSRSERLQVDE